MKKVTQMVTAKRANDSMTTTLAEMLHTEAHRGIPLALCPFHDLRERATLLRVHTQRDIEESQRTIAYIDSIAVHE